MTLLEAKCCKAHAKDLWRELSVGNGHCLVRVNLDYQEPCAFDTSNDKYHQLALPGEPYPVTQTGWVLCCNGHFDDMFRHVSDTNGGYDVDVGKFESGHCPCGFGSQFAMRVAPTKTFVA